MNTNNFWTRVLGIFGILGGLTLLSGDMLFYYDSFNSNLYENMGNASDLRIIAKCSNRSSSSMVLYAWGCSCIPSF